MKHWLSFPFFFLTMVLLLGCRTAENSFPLFNGRDLKGWTTGGKQSVFRVENGILVCSPGNAALCLKKGSYRNFELTAEIMSMGGAAAELYFHTVSAGSGEQMAGYAVRLSNNREKAGSLSGIRNLYFPFVSDNDWYRMKIKVTENRVEVFMNEVRVNEYVQPENPWRGEKATKRLLGEGTFALQAGQGNGQLLIRSMSVTRLPEGEKTGLPVEKDWDTRVTQLMGQGFPLIDYHVHLKGGLTLEQAVENSQKLGINYGIAPNCGLHFPVTNDSSLFAYMREVKGKPIFRGMQAEGREWVTLFSPDAVSKFGYVFTDAMTFTDYRGRRNRIWMPEEVWVDDKEKFMDQMVGKIEAIFSQEPVDIYVNPTVLPASIMAEYDLLWTKERMERVVRVLAENRIALEINARYKVPKAEMIKLAKAAGIKFSFGTNNTGSELGRLEYCLQMIGECGLTPDDIFIPKADEEKPVNVKGLPGKITG